MNMNRIKSVSSVIHEAVGLFNGVEGGSVAFRASELLLLSTEPEYCFGTFLEIDSNNCIQLYISTISW